MIVRLLSRTLSISIRAIRAFGKNLLELFLYFFSTEIALKKMGTATSHATIYRRVNGSAIMTMQLIRVLVKSEAHIAILALRYPPAGLANLVGRIASSVLEQNHLLITLDRLLDGVLQFRLRMILFLSFVTIFLCR